VCWFTASDFLTLVGNERAWLELWLRLTRQRVYHPEGGEIRRDGCAIK